nr:MAG TPA: hypothetical protein [Crassvirales sp.]
MKQYLVRHVCRYDKKQSCDKEFDTWEDAASYYKKLLAKPLEERAESQLINAIGVSTLYYRLPSVVKATGDSRYSYIQIMSIRK